MSPRSASIWRAICRVISSGSAYFAMVSCVRLACSIVRIKPGGVRSWPGTVGRACAASQARLGPSQVLHGAAQVAAARTRVPKILIRAVVVASPGEGGGRVHWEAGVKSLPDDPEHGVAEPVALVVDDERVAVLVIEQDPFDEQAPGGFGAGELAGGAAAGPGGLDEPCDLELDGFERDDVHAGEPGRGIGGSDGDESASQRALVALPGPVGPLVVQLGGRSGRQDLNLRPPGPIARPNRFCGV